MILQNKNTLSILTVNNFTLSCDFVLFTLNKTKIKLSKESFDANYKILIDDRKID